MNPLGMWTNLRSQISSYAAVLGPRFVALVWVGALCAVVWIFGPRLPWNDGYPLASVRPRLILIGLIVALWLAYALFSWIRQRSRAKAEDDAVAESPEAIEEGETRAEIAELRERLRTALKTMRRLAGRRFGYAYDYPWYLMMGAPGAGKTTLLTRSGLKFPLGDADGAEPVKGVGGTRNCNWWFTDRAVLIDTAGRFTTQESGRKRDHEGFLGFLAMLRKSRRRQPVNGVVLALSLTDLLSQDPEERLRDIRAIRQRLTEAEDALGARVPVYVVLTKADRLTGFSRFFDALGQEARRQVWGVTFPYDEAEGARGASGYGTLADIFSREFHGLLTRLNAMLLERLQQENDISERGRIFRFPAQMAALHDALREIVEELSSGTGSVSEPLLRGIYFASATQERRMETSVPGVPRTASSMNRTYFVDRLFRDVILAEAALVHRDARVGKRQRFATFAGAALATGVGVFLLASWTMGYVANRQALTTINMGLAEYETLTDAIPVRDVADHDFLRVLPALERLARSPDAFDTADVGPVPLQRVSFGMDRRPRIERGHSDAYARALGAYLLPRYMVALQDVLADPDTDEARAFETLKHYLSLAGLGPIDRDGLLAQSERIFADLYPGSGRARTRNALQVHVTAMLDRGTLPVLEIDETLVAEVRDRVADRSPAQRVLDLLAVREAARALPVWQARAVAGPQSADAFSAALSDVRIDGLLTRTGFRTVLIPQLGALSEVAANEDWVRGPGGTVQSNPSEIAADAVALYYSAFETAWRDAIANITIAETNSLGDAAEMIAALASEADPLGRLVRDIAMRTDLVTPELQEQINLAELPFDPAAAPDPFGTLRRSLEPELDDGGGVIDALTPLTPLYDEIYQQLIRLNTPDPAAAQALASEDALRDAAQALLAAGRQLDAPADSWVVTIAARVSEAAVGQARAAANRVWRANAAGQCRRAVSGRYPFSTAASADVTRSDFTAIFGPTGLFAAFFDEHLASIVDTTTDPWTFSGGLRVGSDADGASALRQFQRAAEIRAAFFPNGIVEPRVELNVDLVEIGGGARVALFFVGDARAAFRDGLADGTRLIWPPEGGRDVARVMLLPGDRATAPAATGPWAPFRLLDRARITPGNDNRFNATFNVDGRNVTFRLTSGSVNNPFQLAALTDFRCPEGF
ncbi:type VI secretion system membrane subunit TssM [Tateyamaria omphalii]|uniref:type VI secretion system membrane subunit TssM n=1 Tax=Tateyamaria omphalii TaxID=299262 RepID=UPI001C9925D0|nr:type VI secretion system membrane subunit TssM [Tateyamaria omphalii]MBY5931953.1 type VI secretion system membrane subunit TssM [Tateyamaria omphalii]